MYPALAVLQALNDLRPDWQVEGALLWIGGEGGMEGEIVSRQNIDFQTIPAAGLHGVGLKNLPGNLTKLVKGYLKASTIIREFQPEAMFFTGGYLAVPVAYAGRSVPSLVFMPDIEPGLAIKVIANLAEKIALSVEQSRLHTPAGKPGMVTGYPVRSQMLSWDRERALQALDLKSDAPVLLVFGGSKGARSINRAVLAILPTLLPEMQVLHITGSLDWEEVSASREKLSYSQQEGYHIYPFLHEEMGAALRCADLAVSRSGASILGEYPLFELPSILVPYPHAWRYQKTNASYLAERGAAVIVDDGELTERLLPEIQTLMADPDRRTDMRLALRGMARPDAAKQIGQALFELAERRRGGIQI
ncbi:MAG: UDP-N-acetylglucosamine--N-acetylmuramyl-(pentapeptide) pyrophosphoryl-undecaprenol N-acetylglucosamine transferase [Anaerolineales bacterium]